jgi:hypothetical protein
MRQVGLNSLAPQHANLVFDEWWEKANMATSEITKPGLNSHIILGGMDNLEPPQQVCF